MLVKNANFDGDHPLHEINRLFEASDRAGQVLWQPRVDNGATAPQAMIFFQEHCRLAVTFVTPICAVDGRNWKEMDSAGGVAMKNPIKQAWHAAEAVRKTIKNSARNRRLRDTRGRVRQHGRERRHHGRPRR